jgi:non-canonical (house-cleaning) NTP pyrophosphatase
MHYQGAENRARRAKDEEPDCDYYFGVEGGIEAENDGKLVCFAWVVVFDKVLSASCLFVYACSIKFMRPCHNYPGF